MHCTVPAQGKTKLLVPPPPALLGTSSVFLYIHPFPCFFLSTDVYRASSLAQAPLRSSPWARPGAILTSHLAACTAQFPPREKLTSWYLLLPHYLVPPPCFSIFTPFIFFSIERRLPFKFPGTTPFPSLAPAKGFLSYLVTYLAALFWLSIEQCCPPPCLSPATPCSISSIEQGLPHACPGPGTSPLLSLGFLFY